MRVFSFHFVFSYSRYCYDYDMIEDSLRISSLRIHFFFFFFYTQRPVRSKSVKHNSFTSLFMLQVWLNGTKADRGQKFFHPPTISKPGTCNYFGGEKNGKALCFLTNFQLMVDYVLEEYTILPHLAWHFNQPVTIHRYLLRCFTKHYRQHIQIIKNNCRPQEIHHLLFQPMQKKINTQSPSGSRSGERSFGKSNPNNPRNGTVKLVLGDRDKQIRSGCIYLK